MKYFFPSPRHLISFLEVPVRVRILYQEERRHQKEREAALKAEVRTMFRKAKDF